MQLNDEFEFLVLNCTNTRFARRPVRNALYYALNIVSLKGPLTRTVPLPADIHIEDTIHFQSDWEGPWQRLPGELIDELARRRPALAIKFGMGLLRVPERLELKILSYHHGDPREFRGRPAGFYELIAGKTMVGQIVQVISNRLDAGSIIAFAETRIRPHSYRETMAASYEVSPILLKAAVRNCLSGKVLPIQPDGKNYRLPSNLTVLRLVAKLIGAKLRRLAYGAFIEKEWNVGQVAMEVGGPDALLNGMPGKEQWRIADRPPRYQFLADPFPHPRGGFLAEALRRSDGQGEIVHIEDKWVRVLCRSGGHFSYPGTIVTQAGTFLVPEVAEWSAPRLYRFTEGSAEFAGVLKVEEGLRLVDPTLRVHENRVYLFANDRREGAEVLRLWVANDLFDRFSEHPQSPIRISPEGSRMAGEILPIGKRLFRLGQDYSQDYGDGVIIFEINDLSPTGYEEVRLGKIGFQGVRGPHTVNVRDGLVIFDFYRERFTMFAGVRRLRAKIAKRRAARALS